MPKINYHDWDLYDQGSVDAERFKEKVREAVRKNLKDLIVDESIISQEGNKKVKVPIRGLKEYYFKLDEGEIKQGLGQKEGAKKGDIVGRFYKTKEGKEGSREPGTERGEEVYVEFTIDELMEMVFEDFSLPRLDKEKKEQMEVEKYKLNRLGKKGQWVNFDKKRTLIENIKRQILEDLPDEYFLDFVDDDLRFKRWKEKFVLKSQALIILLRDVSGSITPHQGYLMKVFCFWVVNFLRAKFNNVEILFFVHDTEPQQVDEEKFFKREGSGGTKFSTSYDLIFNLLRQYTDWNTYVFHFTDGELWRDDLSQTEINLKRVLTLVNLFSLVITPFNTGDKTSGFITSFNAPFLKVIDTIKQQHDNITSHALLTKEDVLKVIKEIFSV